MALQVTITDNDNVIWTGSYDDFQSDNAGALSPEDDAVLFDHGELRIGGGAAPLLLVTLWETDHAIE